MVFLLQEREEVQEQHKTKQGYSFRVLESNWDRQTNLWCRRIPQ
ncbi:hypothetical protein Gotri_006562 [Gossypium trilobum]|uniref:Uncharacterized protein n=1 Tax=Gossypium trilobum TaxID=34281 RepID=A0A7J9F0B4_9ROSI|nr:hypothetical protein [Gossypium trilobum]